MKKLRLLLITILCLATATVCCFSASAEKISYSLEELGMTITISDSLNVKTASSASLTDGIYLEATDQNSTLRLSISMVKDKDTIKVDSFSDKSYSFMEEYKSNLEALGLSEGKDAIYGDVDFLDFSQKTTTEAGVDIYSRHSITIINGMGISIVSESIGDNFTSDELALIKESLESIRFDSVVQQQKESAKKTTKSWIIGIFIVILTAGVVVLAVIAKKKADIRKALIRQKQQRKQNDYDVLRNAQRKADSDAKTQIGGYKSSADFFDEHFSGEKKPSDTPLEKTDAPSTEKKKISPIKRISYFAKNLSREINSKKSKNSKNNKSKAKRKAVDYDIFSEK